VRPAQNTHFCQYNMNIIEYHKLFINFGRLCDKGIGTGRFFCRELISVDMSYFFLHRSFVGKVWVPCYGPEAEKKLWMLKVDIYPCLRRRLRNGMKKLQFALSNPPPEYLRQCSKQIVQTRLNCHACVQLHINSWICLGCCTTISCHWGYLFLL